MPNQLDSHRTRWSSRKVFFVLILGFLLSPTYGYAQGVESSPEPDMMSGFSPCDAVVRIEVPPETCIPNDGCATLSVWLDDPGELSIKKIRVTFALSADILLCDAAELRNSIHPGGWAASEAVSLQVCDQATGMYTVQEVLLGTLRGVPGGGELFTIDVKGLPGDYLGSMRLVSASVWAQPQGPCLPALGPPAVLHVDTQPPDPISDLRATPVKIGNDTDGTTKILLSFTPPQSSYVEIYRQGFGNYPEYDDPPNPGAEPAIPSYPPGPEWGRVPVTASGQADEPPNRDFWYYVAFAKDHCGNVAAAANMTAGTLNYLLGDVTDHGQLCSGDNRIDIFDLSEFAAHYGENVGPGDPAACLDIGPTTNGVDGRPLTDDRIDFQDLVLVSSNFGWVSKPTAAPPPTISQNVIWVDVPVHVQPGDRFDARLRMLGTGQAQAFSAQLGWDPLCVRPIAVSTGDLLDEQGGMVLSPRPGVIDGALLGRREVGLSGTGVVAVVGFEALACGEPRITLESVDLRDRDCQPLQVAVDSEVADLPSDATRLLRSTPNPFTAQTVISMFVARAGSMDLGIFSVDGRRVRTLQEGQVIRGYGSWSWDGRDDSGTRLAAGIYFIRLSAGQTTDSRRVILIR